MLSAPIASIVNSRHQLTLTPAVGTTLDFTGKTEYAVGNGLDTVTFTALADNATFDSPEPIDTVIENSGLFDGSPTYTDSYGNRTPTFQVWVEARNSDALNYGGLLLELACGHSGMLTWSPPDGWGAPTVFYAWTVHAEVVFSDLDELQCVRVYSLTLTCDPFGYADHEVLDVASTAPPASPKTVVLSDGTSAANWHSGIDHAGPVTSSGGRLVVPADGPFNQTMVNGQTVSQFVAYAEYAPSGGIDLSQTPYISMDLAPQYSGQTSPDMTGQNYSLSTTNENLSMVDISTNPDGTLHVVWRTDDLYTPHLRFRGDWTVTTAAGQTPQAGQFIDNVTLSNTPPSPASSTGKQSNRILSIKGSARTAGSLEVLHDSAALGDVITYTSSALASSYAPNMRPWLNMPAGVVDGGSDNSSVVGSYVVAPALEFRIPVSVLPSGSYLMLARAADTSGNGESLRWATSMLLTGSGGATVTFAGDSGVSDPLPIGQGFVSLGVTQLPTKAVGNPSTSKAFVVIDLNATGSQAVTFDELWCFRLDGDAAITVAHLGSGTPVTGSANSALFNDGPTVFNGGVRGLYAGTQADRTDSLAWVDEGQIDGWDVHRFLPGMSGIYVVTTGAANPTVGVRHRPAFLHFAT